MATANDAVGSDNWATHSNTATTGTGTIDVLTGSLSYSGLATSVGNKVLLRGNNTTTPRDINRAITSTATTLYYSLLLNVIDNTQLSATTPSYFAGFGATAGANVTTLGARPAAMSTNSGGNYRLSIQNISGGTPTFTENAVDLSFGTTYLVVVKYDASTSPTTATLWVNPSSLGGAEPSSTVTNNSGTTTFSTFASIFLRNNATTPKVEIDEFRVGTTWADVTPVSLATSQNEIAGLKIFSSNKMLYVTSDSSSDKNVVVYDLLGKMVVNQTVAEQAINVSNLATGAYIVKVTEDGKTATKKLVIE